MPQLDLSPRGLSASRTVTQEHDLDEFDFVRVDEDGDYVAAQADSAENAEVVGWVQKVHSDTRITVCHLGLIKGLSELTPGQCYFLSADTAGGYSIDPPEEEGEVSKPLFVALSNTEAIFVNQRGQLL